MEDKGKRVSTRLVLWHGNGVDQLLACDLVWTIPMEMLFCGHCNFQNSGSGGDLK